MKTTRPNWNLKKIERLVNGGQFRFDHPIQRPSEQWGHLQKSLLIHSVLCDYPVPPILIMKNDNEDYVIDGKQRITTLLNFISGKKGEDGKYPSSSFALIDLTPEAKVEGVDEELKIANKHFDELPEDLQSELLSFTLQIQRLEDATDEDVEELFSRWNNGTPLSKQQKARAKMGAGKAVVIDSLLKHKFLGEMAQFTPLQRRRSDDEAVILQTMMLMSDVEIESFVADKVLKYATSLRTMDTEAFTKITNDVKEALDYLFSVNTTSPLFRKLHLPTILVVAKTAKDENIDPQLFGDWLKDFNLAINKKTEEEALIKTDYKDHTGAGSVKKNKVLGRLNSTFEHFNKYRELVEKELQNVSSLDNKVEEKEDSKEIVAAIDSKDEAVEETRIDAKDDTKVEEVEEEKAVKKEKKQSKKKAKGEEKVAAEVAK